MIQSRSPWPPSFCTDSVRSYNLGMLTRIPLHCRTNVYRSEVESGKLTTVSLRACVSLLRFATGVYTSPSLGEAASIRSPDWFLTKKTHGEEASGTEHFPQRRRFEVWVLCYCYFLCCHWLLQRFQDTSNFRWRFVKNPSQNSLRSLVIRQSDCANDDAFGRFFSDPSIRADSLIVCLFYPRFFLPELVRCQQLI
jgi:hypothetical protein